VDVLIRQLWNFAKGSLLSAQAQKEFFAPGLVAWADMAAPN
jgi:hypothetical protein